MVVIHVSLSKVNNVNTFFVVYTRSFYAHTSIYVYALKDLSKQDQT